MVGGEEGGMFLFWGRSDMCSWLFRWESAYVGGEMGRAEKVGSVWEREARVWGGYVRVGEGVLDQRVRVWDEWMGRYEWVEMEKGEGEGLTAGFLES